MSKILIFMIMVFIISITIFISLKVIKIKENFLIYVILVVLLIPFSINTWNMYNQYNGLSYLRVPIIFIVMLSISIGVVFKRIKLGKSNLFISILILFIYTILQRLFIKDVVKYYNFIFLYFYILMIYFITKKLRDISILKIFDFINIFAIFNSILSIAQYITGKKLLIGVWNDSIMFEEGANAVKRVVGIVGTNNAAGNFGALLFIIVLYNVIKKQRIIDYLALFFTSIFSILTLTRIGYLAIGISILIFYLHSDWKNKKSILIKYFLFFICIVIGTFIIYKFGYKIYDILFLKRGYTSDYRVTQFKFVIDNIIGSNFWFGVGAGQMNRYIYSNFGYFELDLHSQYLNVLVEQGIFMFINFILFNFWLLKGVLKNYKYENMEKSFIIAFFIGNLICCNYNPNQYYLTNNIVYYLVMFMLLNCREICYDKKY